jgi:hypothetical protein
MSTIPQCCEDAISDGHSINLAGLSEAGFEAYGR